MNYLKLLSQVAPTYTAQLAHRYMSNPRVRKLRSFEEDVLERAQKNTLQFGRFEIQAYNWGDRNRPLAMFVHGWEGQAGNFGALVDIVLEKGYQVVAYDAPSHGKSSHLPTNMFEYADFITERLMVRQPSLIISHSFGTVTTMFGLQRNPDFYLEKWIAITTPYNFMDHINRMKERMGINDKTLGKLIGLLEKDTNNAISKMNMGTMGPQICNFGSYTIIHSRDDKVIPIDDARKTSQCMANTDLIELNGVGHYRILWSQELKDVLENNLDTVG